MEYFQEYDIEFVSEAEVSLHAHKSKFNFEFRQGENTHGLADKQFLVL